MATPDLTCPVCQADIPTAGDEKPGDETYCDYCGAPCRIIATGSSDEVLEAEEDF